MKKEIYTEILSNILDEYNVKIDSSLIESIANDYAEAISILEEMQCEQFINPNKKSNSQMVNELKVKLERLEKKLGEKIKVNDALCNYLKLEHHTEYVTVDNLGNLHFGLYF